MSERYNDIIKLSKKYENTTRRVSMRILVIEDERALCETIVRSLKRLAYSVDFCYDGNKANELLGIEKYDLVLLLSLIHI